MIGRTIKHFRITAKLGQGGMGVVYRAHDTTLDRDVALKFLPPHLTADKNARARFIHEAKAASSLQHPAICAIHDIGETDDGQTYLVMPCYEGETLEERLKRGPMPVEEAVTIFRQVAQGLAKAHGQGIVHRDIKPANIFITADGQAVILDFGLAKLAGQTQLTQEGTTLGTVAYMSPEQVQGEEAGPESDFWSLGVVLHEMLTGKQPFTGQHPQAVMYAIGHTEPAVLTVVPEEVEELVQGLLAKEQNDRRAKVEQLLPRYLDGGTVHLAGSGPGKWIGSTIVMAVLVLAIGGWFLLKDMGDSEFNSIAVLPFESLSQEKDQDFLGDGMTVELISRLGAVQVFDKVISRTSVMQYKNNPKPVAEIANDLDVRALVEGTIVFSGDRARVTATLIDAVSDKQLWSDSFDEPVADILALQNKVVIAIVGAIEKTLSPEAEQLLARERPVNPRAYRSYLKGVHWLNNAEGGQWQLIEKTFLESIEADSTFAPAYAGLAEFHMRNVHRYPVPQESIDHANKYLAKAFEMDPDLAEAYMTKAHILWEHEFKMEEAGEAFQKSIELNPNLAYTRMAYSFYLTCHGRHDDAVSQVRKAIELDPQSFLVYWACRYSLKMAGNYEEAIALAELIKEKFPPWDGVDETRLDMAIHQKDWNKCLELKQKIMEKADEQEKLRGTFSLIFFHHLLGEDETARRLLAEVEKAAIEQELNLYLAGAFLDTGEKEKARIFLNKYLESNRYNPLHAAQIFAQMGDFDHAFLELDKTYDQRYFSVTRLKTFFAGPLFDEFRKDPRYEEFAKKLGVVG